jgi:hypothetical protein
MKIKLPNIFTFSILISPLLLLISVCTVMSATASAVADDSLLFGQKHAYSAVVRSDKKVVTYAKIYLNNPDETELKNSSFTLPEGISVSNLSIYQIILPERCQAEMNKIGAASGVTDNFSHDPYSTNPTCSSLEERTFSFDEYGYGYYDYSSASDSQLVYKEVDSKKRNNTYELNLPSPIKAQKRGAYIVSYIANQGYVSGDFGLYNLKFRTLKVPQSIEQVRVAVDVASDLYTREKRSEITSSTTSDSLKFNMGTEQSASLQNKSLDRLQGSIGSGGTFMKTGKNLTPNEEFVVNGEFADEPWKLNIGWIVGGFLGLVLVIGLLILLLKKAQQQERVAHKNRGENDTK